VSGLGQQRIAEESGFQRKKGMAKGFLLDEMVILLEYMTGAWRKSSISAQE
jgi:hypothetical protein